MIHILVRILIFSHIFLYTLLYLFSRVLDIFEHARPVFDFLEKVTFSDPIFSFSTRVQLASELWTLFLNARDVLVLKRKSKLFKKVKKYYKIFENVAVYISIFLVIRIYVYYFIIFYNILIKSRISFRDLGTRSGIPRTRSEISEIS